jgi:hypothetical protein
MLARVIILLCVTALSVGYGDLPPDDEKILGTWRDNISDPSTRITFRPDHTFIIQAGDNLATFIEGTWHIKDAELVISQVKAAGKSLPDAVCGQRIISANKEKFVVHGIDWQNELVTFTRVR